jgi:hypothetical protein
VTDLLARYHALRRWVDRERRRLKKTGERPTQRYLRRSRLVDSIDTITLRELVRELTEYRAAPGSPKS